jgi:hypothetical protein
MLVYGNKSIGEILAYLPAVVASTGKTEAKH